MHKGRLGGAVEPPSVELYATEAPDAANGLQAMSRFCMYISHATVNCSVVQVCAFESTQFLSQLGCEVLSKLFQSSIGFSAAIEAAAVTQKVRRKLERLQAPPLTHFGPTRTGEQEWTVYPSRAVYVDALVDQAQIL